MVTQGLRITVEPRMLLGKQVKQLRRHGIIPANVYGPGIPSQAIQVAQESLIPVLKTAGRHALISLQLAGEPAPRPVLVREIQRHAPTDSILHVEFYQPSLTETVTVTVPLVLTGVAPAVDLHRAILVENLNHVTVECLPTEIPAHINVDVSLLAEIGAIFHIRDLKLPAGVRVLNDPDLSIVAATAPAVEVTEAPPAYEEVATEAEEEVTQEQEAGRGESE